MKARAGPILTLGQRFRIALAGYAVSVAFGLALVASHRWTPDLAPIEQSLLAAAVALPIALALLWERLSRLKLGEVEITLVEVTPRIDFELASAIQDSQGSLTPQLIQVIKAAIQQNDLELVEVNLRASPYWWSTRLYLLAALAKEYTQIERMVFVEQDAARRYVGMASPRAVCEALKNKFPACEIVFRTLQSVVCQGTHQPGLQVEAISYQWAGQIFAAGGKNLLEADYRELVSSTSLSEWMGASLETETREWDGSPSGDVLYARILSCQSSFVPLVHSGRLEKVVNRQSLSLKIALNAVGS